MRAHRAAAAVLLAAPRSPSAAEVDDGPTPTHRPAEGASAGPATAADAEVVGAGRRALAFEGPGRGRCGPARSLAAPPAPC